MGIQQNDEIITVSNTAIPTIAAIINSGAKPILVDIDEDYLIDCNKIEKAISGTNDSKIKKIIPEQKEIDRKKEVLMQKH